MIKRQIDRIAELEKIKEYLSFEKIGEADKSNLHLFDKESYKKLMKVIKG